MIAMITLGTILYGLLYFAIGVLVWLVIVWFLSLFKLIVRPDIVKIVIAILFLITLIWIVTGDNFFPFHLHR